MTQPDKSDFDDFGDDYYERLTGCLNAYGGRDAEYYNLLKVKWLRNLAHKHLGDTSQKKFLDLGCGTGLTADAIGDAFGMGVGLDLSLGMLKAGTCDRVNCSFIRGDASRLPFPDDSFDLVFSVTLMHHLPGDVIPGMMSEVSRVLRPGGLTVHFDHNPYNFLTRRIVARCEFDKGTTLRPLKIIIGLAEDAGFKMVDSGFLIFIPAFFKYLEPMEKLFKPIPLGGQYFMAATLE